MGKPLQGRYVPEYPKKYVGAVNNIIYRSSWERKFFIWCDRNPRVLKWNSEEIVVPYFHQADGKMRRYFTDGMVKYRKRDDTIVNYLIEIKPYSQTIEPTPPKRNTTKTKARFLREVMTYTKNQDKWAAARAYAEKKGMEFVILTEKELGIKR